MPRGPAAVALQDLAEALQAAIPAVHAAAVARGQAAMALQRGSPGPLG